MKTIKKIISWLFLGLLIFKFVNVDEFNVLDGVFTGGNLPIFTSISSYIFIYLLRLLNYGVAILCLVNVYSDFIFLKKANAFITPMVSLLNLIFFKPLLMSYYMHNLSTIRIILLIIEILLPLALSIIDIVDLINNKDFNLKNFGRGAFLFAVFAIAGDSSTTIQVFFGKNAGIVVQLFNTGHFIIIGMALLIALLIYLLVRKKDKEYVRMILIALSFAGIFRHFHYYEYVIGYNPFKWAGEAIPINLCHLGICLMPVALITRNRKIAVFNCIVSASAGFVALILPAATFNRSLTAAISMHFLVSHILLVLLPVFMFKYKLFDEIKFKSVPKLLAVGGLYWVVVCIANSIFPNFLYGVSYFSGNPITAKDFAGFIPNGQKLLDYVLSFNIGSWTFNIYYAWWPVTLLLLVILVFLGYGLYKLTNIKKKAKQA